MINTWIPKADFLMFKDKSHNKGWEVKVSFDLLAAFLGKIFDLCYSLTDESESVLSSH